MYCLSQTRHSIFLQAKQSLVAILCLRPCPLSYSLELGTDIFTNTSLLSLTTTDNTTVDGAGHAVLLLDVQLGESVLYALTTTIAETTLVDGSVADISL